ncbi:DUF3108 domain-containing protein [Marinobacter sp.]|uniref:DUF3108 domain-containing protein n=1 Tax=Marinobacter sp. TaxID=50741 RepID=UPI00384F7174
MPITLLCRLCPVLLFLLALGAPAPSYAGGDPPAASSSVTKTEKTGKAEQPQTAEPTEPPENPQQPEQPIQLERDEEQKPPPISLTPLRATYSAAMDKGVTINGSATRLLEPQPDGTWILRFDVESFLADIDESLRFRWEDNQVIPLSYRYKLSGFMIGSRERTIDYDWENQTVSGNFEGESFSMALVPGALDPMGYQLQLRQDLKAGKTQMEYQVTDDGDFDRDEFAVIGRETLDTELGQVSTVKVEKVRAPRKKRSTVMWFAPELDYLLVRLVQIESNGSRYEINIEDANIQQN